MGLGNDWRTCVLLSSIGCRRVGLPRWRRSVFIGRKVQKKDATLGGDFSAMEGVGEARIAALITSMSALLGREVVLTIFRRLEVTGCLGDARFQWHR